MQSFRTLVFDTRQDALDYKNSFHKLPQLRQPLWIENQYATFNYESEEAAELAQDKDLDERLNSAHAHWFKLDSFDLDIILRALWNKGFRPKYFTTSDDHLTTGYEYDGKELMPQDGDFTTCEQFQKTTGERITKIIFRNQEDRHQKVIVEENGIVSYNHYQISKMRVIWSKSITKIIDKTK